MVQEQTLSILCVRGLAAAVEQAGVPRLELFRAAQLDPEQLADMGARIPFAQFFHICEHALELTGDPALGLHWAEREGALNLAPVTHLLVYATCLRRALEAILQFQPLLSDEKVFELLESGDKVALRSLPLRVPGASSRMQVLWAAFAMAGIFRLVRFFAPQVRLDRLSFMHAAPAFQAEYERVFRQGVSFAQPCTEMVFDRALLDAPSRVLDEGLRDTLRTVAERRVESLAGPASYSRRVREFLIQRERPCCVDMKTVAGALGIGPKTLQRRLAAEGSSYRAAESEAFKVVATRLLRDQQRTIQETAYAMGFSDTKTFHRAFKNWTGMTPRTYRASVAGGSRKGTSE